jgi:hypothetical protein
MVREGEEVSRTGRDDTKRELVPFDDFFGEDCLEYIKN